MDLKRLIKEKNKTMYSLSKETEIPYSTINDYCNGKKDISKASANTIYKISNALSIPMEELIGERAKSKRKEALVFADAINAIEGAPVSDYAYFLSELWVEGILTDDGLKQALNLYHKHQHLYPNISEYNRK